MTLNPPTLTVGIGAERGVTTAELEALIRNTLSDHGLSPRAVACFATLDVKRAEPAVIAVAELFDRPLRFFTADELRAQTARLHTPSAVVEEAVGLAGICEAAALAAAGDGATLVVPKVKSARTTCAVAARGATP